MPGGTGTSGPVAATSTRPYNWPSTYPACSWNQSGSWAFGGAGFYPTDFGGQCCGIGIQCGCHRLHGIEGDGVLGTDGIGDLKPHQGRTVCGHGRKRAGIRQQLRTTLTKLELRRNAGETEVKNIGHEEIDSRIGMIRLAGQKTPLRRLRL